MFRNWLECYSSNSLNIDNEWKIVLVFWNRVSLCNPGWLETHHPPARLLGLQIWITTPNSQMKILRTCATYIMLALIASRIKGFALWPQAKMGVVQQCTQFWSSKGRILNPRCSSETQVPTGTVWSWDTCMWIHFPECTCTHAHTHTHIHTHTLHMHVRAHTQFRDYNILCTKAF
jgi:hypothetical protein